MSALHELLYAAWNVIANAGGGDWTRETPAWQEAAARWRDEWHKTFEFSAERMAEGEQSADAGHTRPLAAVMEDLRTSVAGEERRFLLEHVRSRAESLIYAAPEVRELHEQRLAEALTELRRWERAP